MKTRWKKWSQQTWQRRKKKENDDENWKRNRKKEIAKHNEYRISEKNQKNYRK